MAKATKAQIQEMHEISQTLIAGKERLMEIFQELDLDDSVLWKPVGSMGVSDTVRFANFLLSFHKD